MSDAAPDLPAPLDVAVEQLRALDDYLARPDAWIEDADHREAVVLALRHPHRLAAQVEVQAELSSRDTDRIAALRLGLERIRVSADQQAAKYEDVNLREARTWRLLEHIAEETLEHDDGPAGGDR